MAKRQVTVKITANFEANLDAVRTFLVDSDASIAFGRLLDELLDAVIPNLKRFSQLGRPFLSRPALSVEAGEKARKLKVRVGDGDLREYLAGEYVILYAVIDQTVYLLSIKHQRQ